MLRIANSGHMDADVVALEAHAARAGAALACAYSSSAEFDAALIAERRAAGIYGPRRHRTRILATAVGIATGLALIIFLAVCSIDAPTLARELQTRPWIAHESPF